MRREIVKYNWIYTPQQLSEIVEQLNHATGIAFDTEFIGEGVYSPRLCLMQVAADTLTETVLIDPFANLPWEGFASLLANPKIEKVLHSPRQDLEIIYQTFGVVIRPVFDTQLAAAFLGYGDQPALAQLLMDVLGVTHEKGERYTDWSMRPLRNAQLSYAAQDVVDLLLLRDKLTEKLIAEHRFEWFREESNNANRTEVFVRNDENAWQKVGDKRGLRRKELLILRSLAAMRERLAREVNRPREYVLSDRALVQLARTKPQSETELNNMRGWKGANPEIITAIFSAIHEGQSRTDSLLMDEYYTPPSPEALALGDLLASWVKVISQRTKIAGSLLAVRSEIDSFARWGVETPNAPMPAVRFIKGWRWDFLGKDLAALATGEKTIGLSSDSEHVLSIK